MQNPQLWLEAKSVIRPLTPAWCPGGRTQQKALRARPVTTASTAAQTEPAARRAAGREPTEKVVSECSGALSASVGCRCRPLWMCGVKGTA
jgi:hypothetical protein